MQSFPIRASRFLKLLLLLIHLLAMLACTVSPLPVWARLALAALLMGSLLYYQSNGAIARWKAIRLDESGGIELEDQGGRWESAQLVGNGWVTAVMVVLQVDVSSSGRKQSLLILSDSLSREDFRLLRVYLRWGKLGIQAGR